MISSLCAQIMRAPRHQTLIFHRVLAAPDPMLPSEPQAKWFDGLIRRLSRGFDVIGLDEAAERASEHRLSGRTLSITFDDGYADNAEVALPILEKYGVPATFFVASGFVGDGIMWNDRIIEAIRGIKPGPLSLPGGEALPTLDIDDWDSRRHAAERIIGAWKHLQPEQRESNVDALAAQAPRPRGNMMMSHRQLRDMSRSPSAMIGGHTRSHPILEAINDGDARNEIAGGKSDLEGIIDREIGWFAYPNGKVDRDYGPVHVQQVREAGFRGAVSTNWGTLDSTSDRFQIPRFTPWQRNFSRFAIDLARSHYGLI